MAKGNGKKAASLEEMLMDSAEAGDLVGVRHALSIGAAGAARRIGGTGPMGVAAREGHAAIVAELAILGEQSRADDWGMTPMMWAASNGRLDCVRVLLPISDLEARSANGLRPVDFAAMMNRASAECFEALWRAGPASDAVANHRLLRLAARSADPRKAIMLMDAGADPDVSDDGGELPIHGAAHRGSRAVVEALLARGGLAQLSVRGDSRLSPMEMAAQTGNGEALLAMVSARGRMPMAAARMGHKAGHDGLVEQALALAAAVSERKALGKGAKEPKPSPKAARRASL